MISTNEKETFPIILEQTRPSILNEKDRVYWLAIHNLIKESSLEIQINKAFWYIDDGIQTAGFKYCGGHFKYNFGFKSTEDKQTFLDEVKLLIEELKSIL